MWNTWGLTYQDTVSIAAEHTLVLRRFLSSFFFSSCDDNLIRQTFLKESKQIKGSLVVQLHTSHLSLSHYRSHVTKHSCKVQWLMLCNIQYSNTHSAQSGFLWKDKCAPFAWSANIIKMCPECRRINTPQERIIPHKPHVFFAPVGAQSKQGNKLHLVW